MAVHVSRDKMPEENTADSVETEIRQVNKEKYWYVGQINVMKDQINYRDSINIHD